MISIPFAKLQYKYYVVLLKISMSNAEVLAKNIVNNLDANCILFSTQNIYFLVTRVEKAKAKNKSLICVINLFPVKYEKWESPVKKKLLKFPFYLQSFLIVHLFSVHPFC